MKKILVLLLVMFLLASTLSIVNASLQPANQIDQIIFLEDGGYIVIKFDNGSDLARASTSKSKSYTRYGENGAMIWKATLTASFTYDGRTASCTSSICSVTTYDDHWYSISKTAWADENIAKATIVIGRKELGVTVNRETHNLSMVCDRYGNVS